MCMRRWSLIFFIWIFSLLMSVSNLVMSYRFNFCGEWIGWLVSTIFLINLIVYHLWVTRKDGDD